MTTSCPSCGTTAAAKVQEARVLQGTCTACGCSFTIVHEPAGTHPSEAGAGSAEAPADGAEAVTTFPAQAFAGPGPRCSACGSPLTVRAATSTSLDLACTVCSTSTTYVAAMPELPHRSSFRNGGGRGPRGGPPRDGPPRARPCRECGGELRFSAQPDGTVAGECAQCGNRFTLPPRRTYGRDDDARPAGPRRNFRGGFRGGSGGFPRAGPGRPRAFRVAYRRAPRERDDDDEEERGPSRRRRSSPRR